MASRTTSRQGSITSQKLLTTAENGDEPQEVKEQRSSGHVGSWVYKSYFAAGGNCCVIFIVFALCVLAQFVASAGDYFIAEWVKMEDRSPVSCGTFIYFHLIVDGICDFTK